MIGSHISKSSSHEAYITPLHKQTPTHPISLTPIHPHTNTNNMPVVQSPPKVTERAYVIRDLDGQDDEIDLLSGFFEEMQKTTVETAQPIDFLSFATCAHWFGVVMVETTTTNVPDEDISDEGEEDDDDTPDDSREPTPPIESLAAHAHTQAAESARLRRLRSASTSRSSAHLYNTLSEDEKVHLWREALADDMQDVDDDPLARVYHEPGTTPVYDARGKFPDVENPDPGLPDAGPSHTHYDGLINWPDDGPSASALVSTSTKPTFRPDAHPQDGGSQTYKNASLTGDQMEEDVADQWMYTDLFGTVPPEEGAVEPIGRELLKPDTTPAPVPMQIGVDPAMREFMRKQALTLQRDLREARVKQYLARQRKLRRNHGRTPAPPAPPKVTRRPIGLIYLSTSQTFLDPLHMGECSLGMYITPEHRGKECLLDAVEMVVKYAFQDPECHRLQSIIVENPHKLYVLELLARAGFRNEGVRRRAFFSQIQCEWKDVTYFAMLATDWAYDVNCGRSSGARLRTYSLWDEVFARHQKECDDLIRLEERSTLKRTLSIETIRERVASSLSVSAAASAAASEAGDGYITDKASSEAPSSVSKKRRRMAYRPGSHASNHSQHEQSGSELGSEWDVASSFEDSGSVVSVPRSATPSVSGSVSGGSSHWDCI